MGNIWLPFLKAREAGLWLYWITKELIICCPAPVILIKNDKLHCDNGPAIYWENGCEFYFLNGVQMKKDHVLTPSEQLVPKDILKESNVEVRRELIRKIGIERMLNFLPHQVIDRRDNYELLNVQLSDSVRNTRYLKMTNPSIGVFHLEGVEGETVQEALNFRAQQLLEPGENWDPAILT